MEEYKEPALDVSTQELPVLKKKSIIREYAESIAIAVLLALVIRTYLVQAFKIPSGSMEDTLAIGDHLLVNKFIYGTKIPFTASSVIKIRDPRQGDVIVFEYPEDPSKDFIKRVVGTPGDVVEGKDKKVFVNGKPYEMSQVLDVTLAPAQTTTSTPASPAATIPTRDLATP